MTNAVAQVGGGFTLAALCAGVVIAHVALTGGWKVLHWAPLRWLGRRSYAAYLWNLPITKILPAHSLLWQIAIVVATLVVAELSWRLVESRFLRPRRRPAAAVAPVIAEKDRAKDIATAAAA